jgi:hypothetical protein
MAIINKGKSFANGEQLTADKLNQVIDNATFTTSAVDNVSTRLSSGAIIVKDGGVTTAKIADANVTFAKLTDVIDDDTMATATDTTLATSKSIKDYVDSNGITQTTGTAPYYGCRAFGSFDGTASSPMTPISSGNIASIVRTATGQYIITLTTAMDSVNYCVVANAIHNIGVAWGNSTDVTIDNPYQFRLITAQEVAGGYNSALVSFSVFA